MELTALQIAVIKQLGYDAEDWPNNEDLRSNLEDVTNHGADTGWHGFTYNAETIDFTTANRKEITAMVKEQSDEMGMKPIEFIASFNCLKDYGDLTDAIGRFVYGGKYEEIDEDLLVYNALAWYALEEVARQLTEE